MHMQQTFDGDMPGSRACIKQVATKGAIYFFFAMAMIGSLLFLLGFVGAGLEGIREVPSRAAIMALGLICLSLFFPWFTCLYFARHLLGTIEKLEEEVGYLRSEMLQRPKQPIDPVCGD